jgi:hypothetical protein
LKKRISLEPPGESCDNSRVVGSSVKSYQNAARPSIGEMVMLPLLKKFFEVILRLPYVNRSGLAFLLFFIFFPD